MIKKVHFDLTTPRTQVDSEILGPQNETDLKSCFNTSQFQTACDFSENNKINLASFLSESNMISEGPEPNRLYSINTYYPN